MAAAAAAAPAVRAALQARSRSGRPSVPRWPCATVSGLHAAYGVGSCVQHACARRPPCFRRCPNQCCCAPRLSSLCMCSLQPGGSPTAGQMQAGQRQPCVALASLWCILRPPAATPDLCWHCGMRRPGSSRCNLTPLNARSRSTLPPCFVPTAAAVGRQLQEGLQPNLRLEPGPQPEPHLLAGESGIFFCAQVCACAGFPLLHMPQPCARRAGQGGSALCRHRRLRGCFFLPGPKTRPHRFCLQHHHLFEKEAVASGGRREYSTGAGVCCLHRSLLLPAESATLLHPPAACSRPLHGPHAACSCSLHCHTSSLQAGAGDPGQDDPRI